MSQSPPASQCRSKWVNRGIQDVGSQLKFKCNGQPAAKRDAHFCFLFRGGVPLEEQNDGSNRRLDGGKRNDQSGSEFDAASEVLNERFGDLKKCWTHGTP